MTRGQRIKQLREENGMTQTEVAMAIRTTKQNIYKYETGIITNIPSDKIEAIANLFSVSPAYLMGWEDDKANSLSSKDYEKYGLQPIKTKKFRMLGNIACGEPIYCDEEHEIFVEASADIKADFCITAKGDSMINARIFDGDIVFIQEQPDVENGEIAAVIIEDEATLKRVYKYGNSIELRAENPIYKPINYNGFELERIKILGKAVAFQSNII